MLGRPAKRRISAGDESLYQRWRNREGGWALGCIEHAKATAGPRANVEESSAEGEAGSDGVDGAGNVGQFSGDGRGDARVLLIDEGEHLERRKLVEMRGPRV